VNGPEVLAAVWRRKLIAIAVLVVTLVATGLYLSTAPKTYQARATLTLVPPTTAAAGGLADFQAVSQPLLATLADVAVSAPVLSDAARTVTPPPSTEKLRSQVVGSAILTTLILRVEVKDPDPARAASLANAVARSLIDRNPSVSLGRLTLVDPAAVPKTPANISRLTSLAIGLLLGLALAAIAAVVADRRLASRAGFSSDVERKIGAPVLGQFGPARPGIIGDDASELGALASRFRLETQGAASKVIILADVPPLRHQQLGQQLANALYDGRHYVLSLRESRGTTQIRSPQAASTVPAAVGRSSPAWNGSVDGHPNDALLQVAADVRAGHTRPDVVDLEISADVSAAELDALTSAFDFVVVEAVAENAKRFQGSLPQKNDVVLVVDVGAARLAEVSEQSRRLRKQGCRIRGIILT